LPSVVVVPEVVPVAVAPLVEPCGGFLLGDATANDAANPATKSAASRTFVFMGSDVLLEIRLCTLKDAYEGSNLRPASQDPSNGERPVSRPFRVNR
jgi:hypothetical protein